MAIAPTYFIYILHFIFLWLIQMKSAVIAPEVEVVTVMLALAAGSLSEQQLSDWLAENSTERQ
jgi:hypothetical protein